MSASDLQAFLRFLSQDAKVPLATAMSKIKDLQSANLDSPEKLAKVKAGDLQGVFDDEKVAKQVVSAAKRVCKKRAGGDDAAPLPKKLKKSSVADGSPTTPADLEASLRLPLGDVSERELEEKVVVSNRAPLVLAFAVTLLQFTMPEQPLSSRLSLAQAYVSTTSRARAVNLGIQQLDRSEVEAEGKLAEGQPSVTIMGKELTVLRRWGYEGESESSTVKLPEAVEKESHEVDGGEAAEADDGDAKDGSEPIEERQPPLWALDIEALRKSNRHHANVAYIQSGNNSGLPIYTPQSARAYLLKSFASPRAQDKKSTLANQAAQREQNLGHLLRALELLYESWAPHVSSRELDKRTWSWYVKIRPAVEDGVAGWGGKNEIRLGGILALRYRSDS